MRLRFSPAPTGNLHIGNMRAALFNWLQARHVDGTFILRIEDTDVARSTQEAVEQIQHVLRWAGLEWDEGPILQSTHFDRYLEEAQRLLDSGHAYECFCTEAEVRERNEQAMKEGRTPGYDGRCRNLTKEQRAAFVAEGRPRSIRFLTPDDGRSTFADIVRGEVSVEWSTVPDFVIVRSNGTPVFFLANAVDDADMGITHVLRGDDLLDSTHRVLALRQALGYGEPPVYAHLPMILGPGGAKLSKRHAAVSVEEYRDAGYLPDALVNYLALLGWGPEDDREVLTIDELIAEFDVSRVNPSSATFDPKKLEWMNGEHIRRMPLADLVSATASTSMCACSNVPSRSRRSARRRLFRLPNLPRSCSFRTKNSSSTKIPGKKFLPRSARKTCSTPRSRSSSTANGATRSMCFPRSSSSG
jgi:glutamyl-tRNA synthetase